MSDFKLEAFTEEDCKKYEADWEHDKQVDVEYRGKDVPPEKYTFVFNPRKFDPVAIVDIKGLGYDDKLRFLRFCFSCDCIGNASIVANLVILAQGRLIDEELYKNEDIFFEDDIEYLDLCTDLREEIKDFNSKIVTYFLGALKSIANLIGDGAEHVPNLYFNALSSYTLTTISSAMQKATVDYNELPYVFNSETIVERICVKKNFVNEFMGELLNRITEEE